MFHARPAERPGVRPPTSARGRALGKTDPPTNTPSPLRQRAAYRRVVGNGAVDPAPDLVAIYRSMCRYPALQAPHEVQTSMKRRSASSFQGPFDYGSQLRIVVHDCLDEHFDMGSCKTVFRLVERMSDPNKPKRRIVTSSPKRLRPREYRTSTHSNGPWGYSPPFVQRTERLPESHANAYMGVFSVSQPFIQIARVYVPRVRD